MPVSLGPQARTGILVAETVKCNHLEQTPTGADHHTRTSSLSLGDHSTRNNVQMKQIGSITYYEFTMHLEAVSIETTLNSAEVLLTFGGNHGLSAGDTVEIKNITGLPFSGIYASDLQGSFILQAGTTSTDIAITASGGNATRTASHVITANVDCTIYKSLDMASSAVQFTRTTTVPVRSYANIAYT